MGDELIEAVQAGVPAWMREASKGVSFGNLDGSDLMPPRLKVLAGQSPEVMDGVPDARPGNFWITIVNTNLGPAVTGTPIWLNKSYQLWAPRIAGGEVKGPLATASGNGNWNEPNQKFQVKFPPAQGGGEYTWEIKKTVFENGMDQFGSSQPDKKGSKPAATLTYDVLWAIDLPAGRRQLCVFTNSKTGVTPTRKFATVVETKRIEEGIAPFHQRWRIVIVKKTNTETGDPYFTYEFYYIDQIRDEAQGAIMRALYDQYSKSGFATDLEPEVEVIRSRPFKEIDDEIPF